MSSEALVTEQTVAVLTVEVEGTPITLTAQEQVVTLSTMAEQGPAGASAVPIPYQQTAPSASWIIPHGLGRIPLVQVRNAAGEVVYPDVFADARSVSIVFANPATGSATLI